MRGSFVWLLLILVLSSLLLPVTARADDCGVELVEALRAKYTLQEMSADTSVVRNLLCHKDSSSGGSSGGFSFGIPADVPFNLGMTQTDLHQRRVEICGDSSLWSDSERVSEIAESLLDDNALEAYKTCKATPGLQCSSTRESGRDVVFTVKWMPFAQLADATMTHDPVTQNMTCRHPSMQVGHVFLGNTPVVAVCEVLDVNERAAMVIATNRGDFVCSVAPKPQAKTIPMVMNACRLGQMDACDEVLLRTHEAAKRCERAAEPNIPPNAPPEQREQLQIQADLLARRCGDLPAQMWAFTSFVRQRRAGCPREDRAALDDMIASITSSILAELRVLRLDK